MRVADPVWDAVKEKDWVVHSEGFPPVAVFTSPGSTAKKLLKLAAPVIDASKPTDEELARLLHPPFPFIKPPGAMSKLTT